MTETAAIDRAPCLTFDWDMTYDGWLKEARDLIKAHWLEAGSFQDFMSLNLNDDAFRALQASGALHILTVRDEGEIIGYFFVMLSHHPLDKAHVIGSDVFIYTAPRYRRWGIGPQMIRLGEDRLRRLGAVVVFFREKTGREGYLERFGYKPHEVVKYKVMRD